MENTFPSIEAAEQGSVELPGTFWFPFLIGRTAASMTFCESKGRTDADQRRMLTPGQSCPTLL